MVDYEAKQGINLSQTKYALTRLQLICFNIKQSERKKGRN